MSFKFMVKLSVKNQRNPSRTRLGRKVSKRFPTLYQTKIYGWWSQKIQGDRDLPRNLISFHLRMSDIPLILEAVTFPIPTLHITNTRFLHGSSAGEAAAQLPLTSQPASRCCVAMANRCNNFWMNWSLLFTCSWRQVREQKELWPIPQLKSCPKNCSNWIVC